MSPSARRSSRGPGVPSSQVVHYLQIRLLIYHLPTTNLPITCQLSTTNQPLSIQIPAQGVKGPIEETDKFRRTYPNTGNQTFSSKIFIFLTRAHTHTHTHTHTLTHSLTHSLTHKYINKYMHSYMKYIIYLQYQANA